MSKLEDRLDALEQELSSEREKRQQLEAQLNTVAQFPEGGEITAVQQVIDDRTATVGLNPELHPFWAAEASKNEKHPHTEAYAIGIGYRRATEGDFVEIDGVSPQERFGLVTSRMPSHVLFVTSKDHNARRQRTHVVRSAHAANRELPKFKNPDGTNATVKDL